MFVRGDIAQQGRNAIHDIDNHIELAVVKQVAHSQPPAGISLSQRCSFDRGHQLELFAADIVKQQWTLCKCGSPRHAINEGIDMSVGDDQVLPTVVVVIEKGCAPTQKRHRSFRNTQSDS